jgi:hypothetical protein
MEKGIGGRTEITKPFTYLQMAQTELEPGWAQHTDCSNRSHI